MKILELQIKSFGKFSNQTVLLHDGVNIIYGKNETGKSTIYAFIRAMFFGLERARGRAARNDEYSLRKPWENPGCFWGAMRFESGGKVFRLERNFSTQEKSSVLVCETDGEELSVENGDLDVLLEGMNEISYRNTFLIGQKGSATDEGLLRELRNYMSNLQNAGDAEVDVSQAIASLEEKRRKAETEKKRIREKRDFREREIQARLDYMQQETARLREEETECLEKLRKLTEDGKQPGAGKMRRESGEEGERKRIFAGGFLCLVLCLIGVLQSSFWLKLVSAAGGMVCLCIVAAAFLSMRKGSRPEMEEKHHVLLQEAEKWRGHLEHIRRELREKQVLEENVRESLREAQEDDSDTDRLNQEIAAWNMAAETIREASREIYGKWEGSLNRRVSQILGKITQGRYTRVFLDDSFQIRIAAPSGILDVRQVSRGTMEQIYFALRMAAGELFSAGEPVPVILDEAFVMYDDERLEEILRWLEQGKNQVILFTCQKRETRILEKIRAE